MTPPSPILGKAAPEPRGETPELQPIVFLYFFGFYFFDFECEKYRFSFQPFGLISVIT